MNKRTLLFVLLCSATFFGMNLFFSYQRDKDNRKFLQENEQKQRQLSAEAKADLQKRTASVSELPLVNLTSDKEGSAVLTQGIDVEGAILTLAWTQPLPQTVYVKGAALQLATTDSVKEGPALYVNPDFKRIHIANVPNVGVYDVQLVSFVNGSAQVHLGEFENETLRVPLGPLDRNALALYKTDDGFLPLGFYEASGNILVELQKLPILCQYCLPSVEAPQVAGAQSYFVLENDTLQLVFTTKGGALAEINLPFESKNNKVSVVKQIGFDKDLQEQDPQNSLFPLHPYQTPTSKEPIQPTKVGGYYPLLRRNLAPEYNALALVSEYPEQARLNYKVVSFTNDKIVLEAAESYRKVTKTYTLGKAPYTFDLSVKVEGVSRGLWLSSGVPEVEIMSNSSSPQIQYRLLRKDKGVVEKLDLPKPKELISITSFSPEWISDSNGYLGVLITPLKGGSEMAPGFKATAIEGQLVPTRLSLIDPQYHPYEASKYPGYELFLPFPGQGGTFNFRVYAGPFEESTLKAVDKIYTDPTTGSNPDYISSRSFYGWFSFISEPFAKFLFVVMSFFYRFTHSWAFSIVLLTVFLRVLLYPLNAWSLKSMHRMREISPEVQAIQKKHKKDPKKAQLEIMALYKERKVNPFTGCLPVLIQLPFLIGMFDLLKSSFQLRGASFIPGWIDNLTAPDVLFRWKQPIFFIGTEFHLLPIILGVVMFFQSKLSAPKKDKAEMTDQERQQSAMGTVMAVVFTVMFYNFPSGLNIYWLSSMLLAMLQQWMTNRMLESKKGTHKIVKK